MTKSWPCRGKQTMPGSQLMSIPPVSPDAITGRSSTYLNLLIELWPLIVGAFVIAMYQGWHGVKRSYLHRDFFGIFFNIILSSAFMAIVAVGVVLCLPFFGVTRSPETDLGLTIFLSAGGMKAVDALIRWKSGYKFIDLMDGNDINELRKKMTPAQREQHKQQCPFQRDCARCMMTCCGHKGDTDGEDHETPYCSRRGE